MDILFGNEFLFAGILVASAPAGHLENLFTAVKVGLHRLKGGGEGTVGQCRGRRVHDWDV